MQPRIDLASSGDRVVGSPERFALLSVAVLAVLHASILAAAPRSSALPLVPVGVSLALTAGPYAILAAVLRRRPGAVAAGAARTLARIVGLVTTIVLVGSVVVLLGRVLILSFPVLSGLAVATILPARAILGALGVTGFALLAVFVGVQRRLASAAGAVLVLHDDHRGARVGAVFSVVFLFVLVALAARARQSDAASVLARGRLAEERLRVSPDAARRAMLAVQRCATAHAARSASGYPSTIVELGPAGDGCLADSLARGRVAAWRLAYTPGRADSTGAVRAYRVVVAPPESHSGRDERLVGDESGIAWQVLDSAVAGPTRHARVLYSPVERMRQLALCVVRQQVTYHLDGLPAEVGPRAPNGSWGCLGPNARPGAPPSVVDYRDGIVDHYVIRYVPADPDATGRIAGFTITARPYRYGVTGLRSYLLGPAGEIHSTPEDRPAMEADPLVPPCEGRSTARCTIGF